MADLSDYSENLLLDVYRNVSAAVAAVYIKLHIGVPGDDGTTNAAAETTRKVVTFAAASAGSMSSNAAATWTSVSTTETYSHISLWDTVGPAGGNCLWVGALDSSVAVTAGDDFEIASGDLTLTLA